MSFEAESTLQEQMAGPSRPRFTGWLTMAPEVDPPRLTNAPSTATSESTFSAQQSQATGSSHLAQIEQPVASTHGFGYLSQGVKLPQRKKRRATFQVGSPGLSADEDDGHSSGRSSHASSDDPEFDVRASFAPMPVYGKSKPSAQLSTYRGVGDQGHATFPPRPDAATTTSAVPFAADSSSSSNSDEGADGLSFGGRRWKGKTVHAVEQELEALRDERLMSHAPDAAYLASRLEGVRRNLEIEERRPTYVPYDEDMLMDEQPEVALAPDASDVVRQLYPFQHDGVSADAAPILPHRPVSNASSVSLVEGETPHDLDFGLQFGPSAAYSAPFDDEIKVHDPNEVSMPPASHPLTVSGAKTIDPAARAAALDARIEVRALRRGDLEQVRDLHAFHGDSDRAPDHGETYASTASFLLRLLVDDRHVCLVAVAKPIPEPTAPLPDLASSRTIDAPISPRDDADTSGVASPAAGAPIDGLKSLHLATAAVADREQDGDSSEGEASSSLSSSPPATSSVFSMREGQGRHGLIAPAAPHTRMISPRDKDGRINNTPATSVFSDVFAERGLPVRKFTLDDLPGPTDTTSAPVKKVLAIPPPRLRNADTVVETETILGVVSAQLSVVTAPSEDHLFGASSNNNNNTNKVVEDASSIIDIHLLTLATAPEERGQGLGAKLLSALHGECMAKARLMAMKVRSRKALPAGASEAVPTVPALSPRYIDEADPGIAAAAATSAATVGIGTQSPFLQALAGPAGPTLVSLRDARPTTGHFLARTYLEVHPSNVHALSLYRAHGFAAPLDDAKAIKRGFYRGDVRIATSERTKRGGTDAWILQRFDGLLEA